MEIFEIKKNVLDIYNNIKGTFNLEHRKKELQRLEEIMLQVDFWERSDNKEILQKINIQKNILEEISKIQEMYDNIEVLLDFVSSGDESSKQELDHSYIEFENLTTQFSNKILLNNKYDTYNAIVTINAGAGLSLIHI